jgi:hypothetical protein
MLGIASGAFLIPELGSKSQEARGRAQLQSGKLWGMTGKEGVTGYEGRVGKGWEVNGMSVPPLPEPFTPCLCLVFTINVSSFLQRL